MLRLSGMLFRGPRTRHTSPLQICPQTKGTNPAIETCGKYYVQFCYEEIILDYILSPFVKATEIGRKTFIYMGGKGGKEGR